MSLWPPSFFVTSAGTAGSSVKPSDGKFCIDYAVYNLGFITSKYCHDNPCIQTSNPNMIVIYLPVLDHAHGLSENLA